jgi:hypothetical protein
MVTGVIIISATQLQLHLCHPCCSLAVSSALWRRRQADTGATRTERRPLHPSGLPAIRLRAPHDASSPRVQPRLEPHKHLAVRPGSRPVRAVQPCGVAARRGRAADGAHPVLQRLGAAGAGSPERPGSGAAAVASFLATVLTEIYLCGVCSCQEEILRRNGRGQDPSTRPGIEKGSWGPWRTDEL